MTTEVTTVRRSPSSAGASARAGRNAKQPSKQQAVRAQGLDQEARAIVEDSRRRIVRLVGAKAYAEVKEAVRRERSALRELRQPPEGFTRDFGKDRAAAKRRVEALVRKLGIGSDKVKAIHLDAREKLRALLNPAGPGTTPGYNLAGHRDVWERVTGLKAPLTDVVPPAIDPKNPHRWFWFLPPYSQYSTYYNSWNVDGFGIDRDFFHSTGGWIGSEVTFDDSDASEGDAAQAFAENWFALTFVPPANGRIDVVIQAECLRDNYDISMIDEFGFSSAHVLQANRLYMEVEEPIPPTFPVVMSLVEAKTDGDDVVTSFDYLTPGHQYFASLSSIYGVGQASPVRFRIGNENTGYVFTDDMAVHCRYTFMWQIRSIGVRVAP